jgi:hypothetical protein
MENVEKKKITARWPASLAPRVLPRVLPPLKNVQKVGGGAGLKSYSEGKKEPQTRCCLTRLQPCRHQ